MKGEKRMGRATLTMPEELKREARAKAIKEGRSLSAVIRDMLAEYVKDEPREKQPC